MHTLVDVESHVQLRAAIAVPATEGLSKFAGDKQTTFFLGS